ncbi:hypothetical protein [Spirosoma sordidisoli]|uniref:Uncharacterized protein n=1 Tax=Spirosoma sordidisoli TaxID=2502893 RepID=A0A4Q2UC00_9BACT|nr:hypothetical protein [Spirosoma sordidisoli]RYC66314.1 hypothetical protein EQG79_30020 [Spirosoma sordidisoli]
MLTENQISRQQALQQLAAQVGVATVARRAGVCRQSVTKWQKGDLSRNSTARVIEIVLSEMATELSTLTAVITQTPALAEG